MRVSSAEHPMDENKTLERSMNYEKEQEDEVLCEMKRGEFIKKMKERRRQRIQSSKEGRQVGSVMEFKELITH
jgi:hypothetical protein